jgi:hypothetical protein
MTEKKTPAELFAEFLQVRDEFDALSATYGLRMQNVTNRDIPRPQSLDPNALEQLDQLERRQHELWDAYRGQLRA